MSATPRPSAHGDRLVSVVIPTFRGGGYLREAVGSVLAQSFSDFELLIVADGCDDNMSDLADADPRVRIIRQPNRGESVARNVGIRAATSDLIAFLDDDDRMLPGRLAAQHDAMATNRSAGLCHTQFRIIDEHGCPGETGYACDVQYLDLLRREVRILMPTTMMRKSLIEEVGAFDSMLRTGQDLDLIYRMAHDSPLAFLPEVLTEYRRHGSNASGDTYEAARNSIRLLTKHLTYAETFQREDQVEAARTGLLESGRLGALGAIDNGRSAWRRRDFSLSLKSIRSAFAMSPSYTGRDLIGNRRWNSRLRSWTRAHS